MEVTENVKLLFELSFVYFCEESCADLALFFYGYFAVLFIFILSGHAVCHVCLKWKA